MLENYTKMVGSGAFREVYLAEYNDRTVAVKTLKNNINRDDPKHRIEVVTLDAVSGFSIVAACDRSPARCRALLQGTWR